MIYVFYALVLIGALLLLADLSGRLVVEPRRARTWHAIGLLAAAVAGLGPLLPLVNMAWSWPYPLFAATYVLLYAAFVAGTLGAGGRLSRPIQRLAYAGFLVIVSLPSWVLLPLTPAVALAGIALVRDRATTQGG